MKSVYVFDAYGTLLDVSAAVMRHADAFGDDAIRFAELWRAKQLEYSWVYTLTGDYEPFWTLTQRALDYTMKRIPEIPTSLRDSLLQAYRELDAYPDARSVLETLRASGSSIGVLSNGNPEMLASAFASAGLATLIHETISVDAIRKFKTVPEAYALVTSTFQVEPNDVTFVSSNRWDVAAATQAGFRCIWVNRAGFPDEYEHLSPVRIVKSLAEILEPEHEDQ